MAAGAATKGHPEGRLGGPGDGFGGRGRRVEPGSLAIRTPTRLSAVGSTVHAGHGAPLRASREDA